ncbi:MAG TPA: hypothetical protein VFU46_12215 [Gemmatimonadales bacterium]|nr:hypothetical protein [Gemmatimonadales bacterium]
MTHATVRTPTHASLLREIARNLERTLTQSGEEHVCLAHPDHGRSSCVCYRDAGHEGRHRCACGAEWSGMY